MTTPFEEALKKLRPTTGGCPECHTRTPDHYPECSRNRKRLEPGEKCCEKATPLKCVCGGWACAVHGNNHGRSHE
jgi:hypothetical protein